MGVSRPPHDGIGPRERDSQKWMLVLAPVTPAMFEKGAGLSNARI
jgi:hypothetical protein